MTFELNGLVQLLRLDLQKWQKKSKQLQLHNQTILQNVINDELAL